MYGTAQLIRSRPGYSGVSFVIPAHNEERYLGPTLDALNQAIEELDLIAEVIVVDDASTDQTASLASQRGAKVVPVKLRNIGAVRNAGAAVAQYPWLIFVDADTRVPAATVTATLDRLAGGDSGGGARVVIPDAESLFFLKRWMYYAVVLGWQVIGRLAAGCYIYCRKDVFEDFGGFNEQYFAAEEYWLSQNLKRRGTFGLVRPPVITSARKLHAYSTWELARFLLVPLMQFRAAFQSRLGLELLYEDSR